MRGWTGTRRRGWRCWRSVRGGVASRPFPPLSRRERERGRDGLLELLACDPAEHGLEQARWTLASLREVVPGLAEASISGVSRLLQESGIRWKRGRDHIHSPDPAYREKVAHLRAIRAAVAATPDEAVLLYLDEVTYYRQPSIGYAYAPAGSADPRAERATQSDSKTRVVGTLEHATGRVVARQQGKIGVPALRRFYQDLVDAYPGRRIYLVVDNWPVHYHPDLLAALEPQASPFPFPRPPAWPDEPGPRAKRLRLPIQLVPLPTYSPWLNPIEKLWRKLQQDVLHLHRLADDLPALRARVLAFLNRFIDGSPDLLRYVGLGLPN
jgi:DDE superfamily endonuclease